MHAIRMLVDADGAPQGHTVYRYEAGEIYHAGDAQPPMSASLMSAFVASGRAVEVDADGNPVATPASRRAKKSANAAAGTTSETTADTAPDARNDDTSQETPAAPSAAPSAE